MENVAKVIIGTWRLVHPISVNSKGENEYPYWPYPFWYPIVT
jgi:hypothetical protein